MKNIFNFAAIVLMMVMCMGLNRVSAQEAIFSEDFTAVTDGGDQQCNAKGSAFNNTTLAAVLPGWSSYKVYPANGKVKLGTGSENGWLQTPALDLSAHGSIIIEFDARAWNTNNASEGSTMTVYVGSTAYTVEGLANSGSTQNVECDLSHFQVRAAGGNADVTIRFEGNPRCFIDNIAIYASTEPAISVSGNATFNNLTVNQAVNSNLICHGYNLTAGQTSNISLTGDSQFTTTVTSAANDDLMSDDGVVIPISFVAAASGNYSATLSISNSNLTNPVTVALTATVIDVVDIPTIAELRAIVDNSSVTDTLTYPTVYRYTGHGYITQKFTNDKTKWMQDETGAIQIYDNSLYLENVNVGREVTNVMGRLMNYYGYVELKPIAGVADGDINVFPSNPVSPMVITLSQLQDMEFMNQIQGQLVKLEGVTFQATGEFTKQVRYVVEQNGVLDTAIYFTSTYDTQVGTSIPTGAVDVVGVNMLTAAYSAGYGSPRVDSRYYVLPRDGWGTGIHENEAASLNVYPNPCEDNVTVEVDAPASSVVIYNMQGQVVYSESVSMGTQTIQTSQLAPGIYVMSVFSNAQLVGSTKIVKK